MFVFVRVAEFVGSLSIRLGWATAGLFDELLEGMRSVLNLFWGSVSVFRSAWLGGPIRKLPRPYGRYMSNVLPFWSTELNALEGVVDLGTQPLRIDYGIFKHG
jgi:hypothetical protein